VINSDYTLLMSLLLVYSVLKLRGTRGNLVPPLFKGNGVPPLLGDLQGGLSSFS